MEWLSGKAPASDIVAGFLASAASGNIRLLMSAVNSGEVYYIVRKRHGADLAEAWRTASMTLPVVFDVPNLEEIREAAEIKARYPIAYADAFAAALALKHDCPLVTGDPEFRRIKEIKLNWIGS